MILKDTDLCQGFLLSKDPPQIIQGHDGGRSAEGGGGIFLTDSSDIFHAKAENTCSIL